MAKKDFHNTGENIDRGKKQPEKKPAQTNDTNEQPEDNKITEVKNASASGLGTIGRNDEDQTQLPSNY